MVHMIEWRMESAEREGERLYSVPQCYICCTQCILIAVAIHLSRKELLYTLTCIVITCMYYVC